MKECDFRQISNITFAFCDQRDTTEIELEHNNPTNLPLELEERTLIPLPEDFVEVEVTFEPSVRKTGEIGRYNRALAIVVMILLGVVLLHIALFIMFTTHDIELKRNPYMTFVHEALGKTQLEQDKFDNERRKVSKDIKTITERVRKYNLESNLNGLRQRFKKEGVSSNETIQIDQISLIGERNTGTRWIYDELNRCFNNTSLKIKRGLTRYKHWFQDEKDDNVNALVVALFRHPVTWTEAMRLKPHHASVHMFLDWEEFVQKPWTMERVGLDLEVIKTNQQNNVTCQQHFKFNDIVSCHSRPYPKGYFTWKLHWSEDKPIYEMKNDGSGEPYENVIKLRRDKILNFLSVKDYDIVKHHMVVRYEDLIDLGTAFVINEIEAKTGIKSHCAPTPPQNRTIRDLDPEFIRWITDNVDWETENLIGYREWQ